MRVSSMTTKFHVATLLTILVLEPGQLTRTHRPDRHTQSPDETEHSTHTSTAASVGNECVGSTVIISVGVVNAYILMIL